MPNAGAWRRRWAVIRQGRKRILNFILSFFFSFPSTYLSFFALSAFWRRCPYLHLKVVSCFGGPQPGGCGLHTAGKITSRIPLSCRKGWCSGMAHLHSPDNQNWRRRRCICCSPFTARCIALGVYTRCITTHCGCLETHSGSQSSKRNVITAPT